MIYPATDPKQVKWKYLISLHLLPIPNSHGIIIPNPLLSMIICIPQSQNLLAVFFVDLQGFWRLLVLLVFLHIFVDFILKINKKVRESLTTWEIPERWSFWFKPKERRSFESWLCLFFWDNYLGWTIGYLDLTIISIVVPFFGRNSV